MLFHGRKKIVFLTICFCVTTAAGAGGNDWTHYGHTAGRHSIAVDGPNTIDVNTLVWDANSDPQDPTCYVEFEGATGPVVYNNKVYAYAKYYDEYDEYTNSQIIAYDTNSGRILWTCIVEKAFMGSWSSPCIDSEHNRLLIGSGYKVYAFDANSGAELWSTQLENRVVNASVCVADDIPYARAFITDYSDYESSDGRLYCINLDTTDTNNPYQPGEIVWSDILGGTSGNTPAYKDGVVYVASVTDPNGSWQSGNPNPGGTVHAYDAKATYVRRLWRATDPNFKGFCGGVTVTEKGFLYAANYDFYGQEDNSALCKIDCNDGSIVWITQTERTSSTPIVVGDRIYIAGGLDGYGSRPKVETYRDLGTSIVKLWETPASMIVGGWTHQPAYANGKLYVGAIGIYGPYTDLYIFDTKLTPDEPNFTIGHYSGSGNSPAVTYDSIYTTGYDGLFKFNQPALLGDITKDDEVGIPDLEQMMKVWLFDDSVGLIRSDLYLDGKVNIADFALLAADWLKVLK
ncbi:MAG: PQQ-binding-like beta-propeller repeat protein [Sedimentisphaerales bacterium]|nr:PQQ-binding-like beta-propeller repeat protein [Sedimentisphaerales bacterium]